MLIKFLVYTDGIELAPDERMKLGYTDWKVLGYILGNVDGIILGIGVGTEMGCFYGSFDDSNGGKLEGLFLGDSLGFTAGKLYYSD